MAKITKTQLIQEQMAIASDPSRTFFDRMGALIKADNMRTASKKPWTFYGYGKTDHGELAELISKQREEAQAAFPGEFPEKTAGFSFNDYLAKLDEVNRQIAPLGRSPKPDESFGAVDLAASAPETLKKVYEKPVLEKIAAPTGEKDLFALDDSATPPIAEQRDPVIYEERDGFTIIHPKGKIPNRYADLGDVDKSNKKPHIIKRIWRSLFGLDNNHGARD